ncbi:hypothetical protein Syun_030661 [Stephania yunnanensis]|uniref:Uncharacterized protein n=1 Tax=Stephania yunnanensis TaxID=152371 RepID=A0AAP0HAQ0_9MAGN
MGGQGNCVDGKLDDSGYSSPVPLIGLYITGATLVCLLFILVDAFAGFRNRKSWLPCRLFSVNSVTLTLLSIAVKLPLDLTSSMPRVQDQLSKLTGTTLICICMGVFMPSLGTYRESECFNNMAALSIFVVTIVVNVCIQMRTGVIILFRTEHVIILCCLMILLVALWYYASEIHSQNEITHDGIKDIVVDGKGSMLQRLKMSYLCGFNSNPQFRLCRHPLSTLVATLCVLSLVVLLKATFQYLVSKKLNICGGVSVYKWSMTPIIVSQIVTIIVKNLLRLKKVRDRVSSLSVVLLVRIATISLPSSLSESLLSSLNEVFEVLQFVDRKMSTSSFENEKKYVLAEALLVSKNFNCLLPAIIRNFGYLVAFRKQPQLIQSIAIIKGLKEVMQSDYVQHELAMMTDFIQLQAYESVDELYGFIEQLFVDMLDEFLVQLPNAILREIIESNAEDCQMTVKFALKVLCKVEPLESLVQWSFPVGTTITELARVEFSSV